MTTVGLIPPEVLEMMRAESSAQFSQEVTWLEQVYGPDGEPARNSYGESSFQDPKYIPGRAVTVWNEAWTGQGFVRVQATQWYLPPNTGVRAGDQLYGRGDDPKRYPPIESVSEVPDPANSVYELATTGFGNKG